MRLVFGLFRELVRALLWPLLALRRWLAAPLAGYVAFEIEGAVRDVVPRRRFFALPRKRATSLYELARTIDLALEDPRVRGIVVTLRSFHGGMATAQSLREQLARARDAGRDVVVHMPLGGDTRETYIATGASRVFLGPRASLSPVGFARHVRYVRAALDRAHLVPEVYARGRYKSAGEQVTRESMSEPQREQLDALLDGYFDELLAGIADGRKKSLAEARAVVEEAPYLAEDAIAAGLIDGAAYEDELLAILAPKDEQAGREPVAAHAYARARRAATFRSPRRPPVIAIIEVHGAIAHRGGLPFGMVAVDDAVIAAVRAARQSRRVRGVILHVDSPGGSALASDRMHHELVQLAREKPLVACMANVAASGGYYVAAPAHVIVAQPTTITGSIGVVSARMAIDPLLARLGIYTEVVSRGARAELFSATRPLTEDEQHVLARQLEGVYRAFLEVVASGRKRSIDEIAGVAEGRVWTGKDALRVGLVDQLGGFELALAVVRTRIGRGAAHIAPVVVRPPRSSTPLPLPIPKPASAILAMAGVDALELAPLGLAVSGEGVLAWCATPARFA